MDHYLTFLYIRSNNAGTKTIRMHKAIAASAALTIVVLLMASVVVTTKYAGHVSDSRMLATLQAENEMLTRKIGYFQEKIDDLKLKMEQSFDLQNQARLLASLDGIDREVWQVGVGGPEVAIERKDLPGIDLSLMNMEEDLERMIRQSELQLESCDEIVAILEKEKKIRNSTPSIKPLKGGFLSSRFGRRMDPFTGRIAMHQGLDYHARQGSPVVSTADGVISMAKKKGSFGLVIEVNHGNGFKTRYAHLQKILVKRGQRVKRGEVIGRVGKTGRTTGSNLHYEVIFRKINRNPLHYIIPEGVYFN